MDEVLTFSPPLRAKLATEDFEFVVTGGGGWLGQATLEMLENALGDQIASRVHVFGSRHRELLLRSRRRLVCHELNSLAQLRAGPCIVAHYAFLTRSLIPELSASDFRDKNTAISQFVAAQMCKLPVAGIFIPSSGAVYRTDRTIDDDLDANPYGVLKARDERRFLELAKKLQCRAVVSRVFNLAGPFINRFSTYALASILLDIGKGGPIHLRADRPVVRSYVHVEDVINLAFALMLDDRPPPNSPFDTAGAFSIEIGDLARLAARVLGKPDIDIIRPQLTSTDPDYYVGDGKTFSSLMARFNLGLTALDRQISDTANYLDVFGNTTQR